MKKPLLVLLLSLPLSAAASGLKTVAAQVKLKADQKVRVEMDMGELAVTTSTAGSLTYRVEFVRQRQLRWFFGRTVPTEQDLADSTASFDAAKGVLTIRTGKRLKAIATIGVPAKQALDVALTLGTAEIGPVTGKLKAFVETGTLEYDASALAAGVCVDAALKAGSVENRRDQDCKSVSASLRAETGTISVD